MLSNAERDEITRLIVDQLMSTLAGYEQATARRVVTEEVTKLIRSGKDVQPAEVARFEERITDILQGKIEGKSSTIAKKTSARNDEWAMLAALDAVLAHEEKAARSKEVKEKVAQTQKELKAQSEIAIQKKKLERDAKKQDLAAVDAKIKEWRQNEVQKRQQRWEKMQSLKAERERQLDEKRRHTSVAAALRRVMDGEAAASNAAALKHDAEVEQSVKQQSRAHMKQVIEENAVQRAQRDMQAKLQVEQDIKLMEEYAAALEKQEKARLEQLERVKAVQARQAEEAAARPESKRWMDPELIQRQLEKHAAKVAAEEQQRATEAAAILQSVKATVAAQLQEKKAQAAQHAAAKHQERASATAAAHEAAQAEREHKAKAKAVRGKVKSDLDGQVQRNRAAAAAASGMNEVERKINAELLKKAERCVGGAKKQQKTRQSPSVLKAS